MPMINPIGNTHSSNREQGAQANSKPAAPTQKPKTSTPQDTVTIKSGGDADRDDSK